MSWPVWEIPGWDAFLVRTAAFPVALAGDTGYIARGQADAVWRLTPSLLRLLPAGTPLDQALSVEQRCLNQFKAQVHLHLADALLPPALPMPTLTDWWSLMQHYQAPTRFLDWTASLFVAAYFAAERMWDTDGAVYVVHYKALLERTTALHGARSGIQNAELTAVDAPHAVYSITPPRRSERIVAQQGSFTFSMNLLGDQHEIIIEACAAAASVDPGNVYFEKWVLPARLKSVFLHRLRSMNITAQSLFPGGDGLGRSIAEVARLALTPS